MLEAFFCEKEDVDLLEFYEPSHRILGWPGSCISKAYLAL